MQQQPAALLGYCICFHMLLWCYYCDFDLSYFTICPNTFEQSPRHLSELENIMGIFN